MNDLVKEVLKQQLQSLKENSQNATPIELSSMVEATIAISNELRILGESNSFA